jgi:hypothetical protein
MSRFQQGSLLKIKRKGCPDVWVFRWHENATGKRVYKMRTIGSVAELPTRRDAEKAVVSFRININYEVSLSAVLTVGTSLVTLFWSGK